MKKLVYIFLLVVQVVAAQSFDKGNTLFRKGDYKGAVKEFEGILANKQESAEVYFNLGNAYYKLNRVAPAVYNYEKALQLSPGNKDVEINLAFAQKMVLDDIKAVPQKGFSAALYNRLDGFHYNTWGWVAVAFSFLILLSFALYYFSGRTLVKRIFFITMFVAVFGVVFSIFAALFVQSHQSAENPAVIFAEVISVKAEPDEDAAEAFVLHAGTKVNVTETLDGWKKIQLPDENVGWLPKSALKEVKAN
ncbi:BatE protein [Flavobacterium akiainvivens]|uniref:BatE protein n=1 Tax=Flavobacterium akiainvivens TaxID=1202724 RepID=A0A0M8ME07_9FLAO|nr:tetratricopeptide repeat protein [Flavobacterium akiainvivens]KOS06894.1 BatE protein [Flavobacterium akiainvivens]